SDIENTHRRAVDEAQAYPLARPEQSRPVGGRRLAVDEVGVGGARYVQNVGRAHAHAAPFETIGDSSREALAVYVANEGAERALMKVVIVALEFHVAEDGMWLFVRPVGEKHHVIA